MLAKRISLMFSMKLDLVNDQSLHQFKINNPLKKVIVTVARNKMKYLYDKG